MKKNDYYSAWLQRGFVVIMAASCKRNIVKATHGFASSINSLVN